MSAPIAEPLRSAPIAASERSVPSAATIIGIALVLMLVSVLAAFLIVSRGGPIDGALELESAFGVRAPGPDYAVIQARKMPAGAKLLVFEDSNAPQEPEPAPAAEKRDEPAGENAAADKGVDKEKGALEGQASGEHVDWARVAIPAAKARPRRVTFLFPEDGTSHEVVESFFRYVERKSLAELGPEGGKVVIASGKLGWRGFDADWIHERVFEKGGTFRDAMSVDLSLEKRPCVVTAIWTRGEPASRIALDQLLESLAAK